VLEGLRSLGAVKVDLPTIAEDSVELRLLPHLVPDSRQVSQWNTIETSLRRDVRHSSLRWIVGIAASLLLLFAAGTIVHQHENTSLAQDTYTNAKDAYAETSRALMKFSKTLNKGIAATEDITKKTSD